MNSKELLRIHQELEKLMRAEDPSGQLWAYDSRWTCVFENLKALIGAALVRESENGLA